MTIIHVIFMKKRYYKKKYRELLNLNVLIYSVTIRIFCKINSFFYIVNKIWML